MDMLKSRLGMHLVWWFAMIGLIVLLCMAIWTVLGNELQISQADTIEVGTVLEAQKNEVVVEDTGFIEMEPAVIYWPDADASLALAEEETQVIEATQAYLSDRDMGYWSYIIERYNYPFALVSIEDNGSNVSFLFEVILKNIDSVWQVVYESSTPFNTPQQHIIDQYNIPTSP